MRSSVLLALLVLLVLMAGRAAGAASHRRTLALAGGTLDVTLPSGLALSDDSVMAWVRTSARAVVTYYGRFPVAHARLLIRAGEGDGVGGGSTFPTLQSFITVGVHATAAELTADWVMTHELTHLCFPSVPDEAHWMQEGMATYVEPLGRVRAGGLSVEKVWGDLIVGLPQGLPQAGDRGLDRTPTWGRTYWGGALFFLLADVEIRRRTHNQKGLEHALRAIAFAGGTIDADWTTDRVLSTGDGGTGVPVLRELYDQMATHPYPVDLDALWKKLGVSLRDNQIVFDDHAPEAAIRRAITTGN